MKKETITRVITKDDILRQFKINHVKPGMILEVHSSMSQFGYVIGGAQAVNDALLEAIGHEGTLMMPLHCSTNSEPTYWQNPPIPYELIEKVRENIPAFDKKNFETSHMGVIPENLRRRSGAIISNHPAVAHVSYGKFAKYISNRHSFHFPLGMESPIGRIAELHGYVLLMGCSYDNCTLFHLAEEVTKSRAVKLEGSAVESSGMRLWKKYLTSDYDVSEFIEIGKKLESQNKVHIFQIGNATCRLFKIRDAVNEAILHYQQHSKYSLYQL